MREIKKDGAYVYGPEKVERAVEIGTVNTLLILDEMVREEKGEKLMKKTEELGGNVVVISSTHEGGEKLDALGSLGALLRYKIE